MRYLLLVLLSWLVSCAPPIVFTEPQPDAIPERYTFERFYQGTYFCTSDSAIVHIEDQGVYKERALSFEATPAEIEAEEGIWLDGDQLYIEELDQYIPITYSDSALIEGVLEFRDTLFWIGPDQVLKYYHGHQILNKRLSDEEWGVQVLSMTENGDLSLWTTKVPADLEALEKITPVEDLSTTDRPKYRLTPNIVEFRYLLRSKLIFEACDYYERIDRKIEL